MTLLFAALAVLAAGGYVHFTTNYDEPAFTLVSQDNGFELRDYAPTIAAQTTVDRTGRAGTEDGFRILANYIFGDNQSSQKIPMTVPVATEDKPASEAIAMTAPVATTESQGRMTMQFFMPSNYTMETLPRPNDKRVELVEIPARRFVVHRFSGMWDEKVLDEKRAALRAYVTEKGYKTKGDVITAFYNPPMTLPFMRRNEVMIEIAK